MTAVEGIAIIYTYKPNRDTEMNYEEAKAYKQTLEALNNAASDALKEFDKYGKTEMGMTPDFVKAMPEFKAAKLAFDISFNNLRNFNGKFNKAFKKEIAQERKAKYAAMTK